MKLALGISAVALGLLFGAAALAVRFAPADPEPMELEAQLRAKALQNRRDAVRLSGAL